MSAVFLEVSDSNYSSRAYSIAIGSKQRDGE